jgi:hypothetical protein
VHVQLPTARCEAKPQARLIGQVQSLGDAFKHVNDAHHTFAVHDKADGALGQAGRGPDPGLAGTSVLAQKPEQGTDIAVIQSVADLLTPPEPLRDAKRVTRTRCHQLCS